MKLSPLDCDVRTVPGMSRRREIRLEPPQSLLVSVPTLKGRLMVKDISTRGLCLVSHAPLTPKSIHTVTLSFGRITVTGRARVVHAVRDLRGRWSMGLQFLAEPTESAGAIEDLVNSLLSTSISFS